MQKYVKNSSFLHKREKGKKDNEKLELNIYFYSILFYLK